MTSSFCKFYLSNDRATNHSTLSLMSHHNRTWYFRGSVYRFPFSSFDVKGHVSSHASCQWGRDSSLICFTDFFHQVSRQQRGIQPKIDNSRVNIYEIVVLLTLWGSAYRDAKGVEKTVAKMKRRWKEASKRNFFYCSLKTLSATW